MRGADTFTESLFTMRRLEDFVPPDHPLRPIWAMVNCRVPCDYVPRRSWPLFKARELMHGVIASFKHKESKP